MKLFRTTKTTILLVAFSISILTFTSCDDDDSGSEAGTIYLPIESVDSDGELQTFSYDSQKRLTESKYTDTDGDTYTQTYSYSANGDLVAVVEVEKYKDFEGKDVTYTSSSTFEYKNDTIIETKLSSSSDNSSVYTYIYKYILKNGLVSKKISQWETTTYEYDQAGNIIKEQEGTWTSVYTYDEKNGVMKNVNMPKWYKSMNFPYVAVNNVIKEVYTSSSSTSEYIYSYTYNNAGYPITRTDEDDVITIKYIIR